MSRSVISLPILEEVVPEHGRSLDGLQADAQVKEHGHAALVNVRLVDQPRCDTVTCIVKNRFKG